MPHRIGPSAEGRAQKSRECKSSQAAHFGFVGLGPAGWCAPDTPGQGTRLAQNCGPVAAGVTFRGVVLPIATTSRIRAHLGTTGVPRLRGWTRPTLKGPPEGGTPNRSWVIPSPHDGGVGRGVTMRWNEPQPSPRSCLAGRGSRRIQRLWVYHDAPRPRGTVFPVSKNGILFFNRVKCLRSQ